MTDQTHTIVALNDVGDSVRDVETFEDWGLAIEECGLLNHNLQEYPRPGIAGYEVVTTSH